MAKLHNPERIAMPAVVRRTSPAGIRLVLLAAAAACLLLPRLSAAQDFAGSFEGDGAYLELELDEDIYAGVVLVDDQVYLCRANRGGPGLVGILESDAGDVPFQVEAVGRRLVLTFGGTTYNLRPLGDGEAEPGTEAVGSRQAPLGGGGADLRVVEPGGERGSAAASGFTGRFQGSIQGTPAVLSLEQQGSQIAGRIDASGYPYALQGEILAKQATGQVVDPQTGGGFDFEATLSGDLLDFVLVVQDPLTDEQKRKPITFRRLGAEAPREGGGTPGTGGGGPQAVPAGQRDLALVGLWRQSESMSGGGTSVVVETFLEIDSDGTWAIGGGRAVGGGAGWGGDTGSAGVQETGYWKTESQILYVQAPGTGQWQPFARYYVEPGRLMFTFGDNSRQVLYRVR